jgi:hypothetical protein
VRRRWQRLAVSDEEGAAGQERKTQGEASSGSSGRRAPVRSSANLLRRRSLAPGKFRGPWMRGPPILQYRAQACKPWQLWVRLYRLLQRAGMRFVAGSNPLPTSFIFQEPVERSPLLGRGHVRNELGEMLVVSAFVRGVERRHGGKQ